VEGEVEILVFVGIQDVLHEEFCGVPEFVHLNSERVFSD
jgi:hypothetical protein